MISIPTVLILGAGSSAHCGYPLGAELVSRLCRLRGTPELDSLPEGWTRDAAETLLTRLSRSGYYSIDEFLEINRDHAPLGKFLIAREMKKHEDLNLLFPPNKSGWYQYLLNSLLVDGHPEFAKNSLGIITFNYDRSLEAYLDAVLQNRFQIDQTEATRILKELSIVHVHGILGEYPNTPYSREYDSSGLLSISQQIQIIHEIIDQGDEFCNLMFRQGHDMLRSAERIFFLGFGFHPDNLRRFRFFTRENTKGKMLRATTYQLEQLERNQLISSLADAGFTQESFPHNSANCEFFFRRTAYLE